MMTEKKFSRAKQAYGLTSEIFASRRDEGETIIVGGVGAESNRWTRVLTRRAAHHLWFQLTRLLFPEKSPQVTGMAQTAPLSAAPPAVTTHFEVWLNPDTHRYDILGWVNEDSWWFCVDEPNAHRLWAALDLALYPAGWSGPEVSHKVN
jgi:hypothetical protein